MTASPHPTTAPSRLGLRSRLAAWLLRGLGWTVDVTWPPGPRGVVIVYPHTSNWDFPIGYLARLASGVPLSFLGKDSLFRGPAAPLLRRMGGIPVRRGARAGIIAALATELRERPWLWIALAPEGTRAFTDHWKSGFYHLARAAEVPVGIGAIDWARRRVTLREYVTLTGDPEADLERFRAAYQGIVGYHPEQASTIRFRDEAEGPRT
jgi:1-acyl-sn-glycerol-3-phosphate acyltransferase